MGVIPPRGGLPGNVIRALKEGKAMLKDKEACPVANACGRDGSAAPNRTADVRIREGARGQRGRPRTGRLPGLLPLGDCVPPCAPSLRHPTSVPPRSARRPSTSSKTRGALPVAAPWGGGRGVGRDPPGPFQQGMQLQWGRREHARPECHPGAQPLISNKTISVLANRHPHKSGPRPVRGAPGAEALKATQDTAGGLGDRRLDLQRKAFRGVGAALAQVPPPGGNTLGGGGGVVSGSGDECAARLKARRAKTGIRSIPLLSTTTAYTDRVRGRCRCFLCASFCWQRARNPPPVLTAPPPRSWGGTRGR